MIVAALGDDLAGPSVIAAAAAVGELFGADVELLNVRDDGPALAAEAAASAAGLTLRTLAGDPVAGLRAAAEREDVVALVIAASARGAQAGQERRLGSTLRELVTSLATPVVVAPPDHAEKRRERAVARLLVPLDGTTSTAAALHWLMDVADQAEVETVLVHVLDAEHLPAFSDQPAHEVRAWSDAFIGRNLPDARMPRLELRAGRPDAAVREVLEESGADLVALGWSRELSAGRAPVVTAILSDAGVPVLLTPV